ncbi:MAG: 50S ribosomal protein L4 [Gammaproteobacteria bacterium]|nr:50S ribosomal protein L4 [Gammaproteobacteria bacterium]MDH3506931.1 50S ribosomal protein L4 [Gammaproteobacteria bacterium]
MKLSLQGKKSSIEVADAAFGAAFNEPLVHQVVTAYLAGARAGTKAQKRRSDVRGGGAKPWRQKGTGRARAGTSRSPIWVGGGRAFAARPRDFSQKVNRKMYRGAMCAMLSELVRQKRLLVMDEFGVSAPKTKELRVKLQELGTANALIVVEGFDEKLWLAARNLPHVEVLEARSINPASLAKYDHVVMTVAVVKMLEERLG